MSARRYEQRLRAERTEDTRRRLIDAATERLLKAPAEPVSLDQIARDARVARSTIYLVFGSRAGLFDAVVENLWKQAGFARVVEAVEHPDAREHMRAGIRALTELYASIRDLARTLFSLAAVGDNAVGGAIHRAEGDRAGGIAYVAKRLSEQHILRTDVTADQAADLLWLLTSFETFDLLYTGRRLPVDEVSRILVTSAERTLCR